MRRRVAVSFLTGVSVLLPLGASSAAPPPPPPPGAIERATAIVLPPDENGLADYANLFAEDVVIFEGDKKMASTRAEFLSYLRARIGLHVKPLHISYGNPILVAETVSNFPRNPMPGVVYDCCFWARVASYHLARNGRVDQVRFLENGAYWGPPEKPE
jgi:hypothetical protein